MDNAQRILFGTGFPRTVGWAVNGDFRQHFVHSPGEFDLFFDHNRSDRNLYSSICRFRSDMRPVLDKVIFDFDSPMKDSAFPSTDSDKEKIQQMRKDDDLAREVLGSVWDDVQSLVSQCRKEGIPVVSVFSGLGVHCHLLYQEKVNPVREKVTTSKYFVDECDLETWDRKVITDTRRVLRIPNSQRVSKEGPTGVWCIPITEDEVMNNSVHDLLERCTSPKSIDFHERYEAENRPTMEEKEGYGDVDEDTVGSVELEDRDIMSEVPSVTEWIVRNCIMLPCVSERFLRSNPDHMIRFNGVVSLYQSGFTPEEAREIIRNLGWVDYDEKITRKMTEQIWNRGYSESTCNKIQSLGLCVHGPGFDDFSDNPSDCEVHRYESGDCLWKKH